MRLAVFVVVSSFAARAQPVQEIVLTDLAAPQVVTISAPSTLRLKHPGPSRAVTVFGVNTVLASGADQASILKLEEGFDGPFKVTKRSGDGPFALIITADTTVDSPPLVLSPPPPTEGLPLARALAKRDLSAFTLAFFPNVRAVGTGEVHRPALDLPALWATIPEGWVVFTDRGRCSGAPGPVGEPVLVTSMPSNAKITVQRMNGTTLDCIDLAVTLSKPAMLRFSPPRASFTVTDYLFDDEHFLAHPELDQAIAKYAAKKVTTRACAEGVRKKLDPDQRAGHYDLVTRDAQGNDVKVEAFDAVIARKIDAKCKLTALNKERDAIYARLSEKDRAVQQQSMEALAQRLGLPIDPQPEKSPMYRLP